MTFVISLQGRNRFWCGILTLGLPLLFLLAWFLNPGMWEWHVSGAIQRLVLVILLGGGLAGVFVAGLYYTLCEQLITLAPAENSVRYTTRFLGRTLRRQQWNLSEFQSIEVRHHEYSDAPGHVRLTVVGITHTSDSVIWLRSFWSPENAISRDALALAVSLRDSVGLRFDLSSASVTRIGQERIRSKFPR